MPAKAIGGKIFFSEEIRKEANRELSEKLPNEWEVREQYNLDYLRFEIAAIRSYEDALYQVEAHYETVEIFDEWWEGDLERFIFLISTFPASRVIFKEVFRRYDDDEPFFAGYRFLMSHSEEER